ncbi:MAG: cupin domain-containing protein [Actinobacteria bacterium]|nr:cupin domain-containing protein [Actinomycetota bacterium]
MEQVRWLVDPYMEWVQREGVPVVDGLSVDLTSIETSPWPRLDADCALIHLAARGDYVSVYVCDVPAGGATAPQRHLFEEVFYVLDGEGSTSLKLPDGSDHTFEWGTGSLFSLPLNVQHRHYNARGKQPSRLVAVTNLPLMMNLFREERFVFEAEHDFSSRPSGGEHFTGDGTFVPNREHRHMWETNFVPDLRRFDQLRPAPSRGPGSSSIMFILADSSMHAHLSEFPAATYKKGHRHAPDFHLFQLSGRGYSLYWYDEDEEYERIDWQYGVLHSPPDQMWHQHFNSGNETARYLAVAFGSLRYPITETKRAGWMDDPTKKNVDQIEYEDEDPRIRSIFEEELRKNGIAQRAQAT